MADTGRRRSLLDEWVRNQVRQAVDALDAVTACNVEDLCEDIDIAIHRGRWFWATTACGLLGELLYGAVVGGRYPGAGGGWRSPSFGEATRSQRAKWRAAHEGLRALRNACCHPALVAPQGRRGDPATLPHEDLAARIRESAGWHDLALAVGQSPAALKDERLTAWALDVLNEVGQLEIAPASEWKA